MKQSIRIRFTVVFFVIISIMILCICMVNTFGLEIFYRNARVKELKKAYQKIDSLLMETDTTQMSEDTEMTTALTQVLEEYSNKYNISIAIIDSYTNAVLISSERDGEVLYERIQSGFFDPEAENYIRILYEDSNNKITLHEIRRLNVENSHISDDMEEMEEYYRSKTAFIESFGYCSDNQTMIIMSTPVASLEESVSLSNSFFLYIGITILILGLILIYIMTRRITQPILELADISKRMGKLDFTAEYTGSDMDEIGILGQNMNMMSEKLESTIDELKQANIILQNDIKKKEEIDIMRKDFIANVSHELKTPIALIQGYAEGLSEGLCEDPESRQYYTEVIIDEANKMNLMVKQLLNLSALESGVQKMEMKAFDIVELIAGVIASTSILLTENSTKIILKNQKPFMVMGDEFKIEEVITNLISNAIHHVSTGGEIQIQVIKKETDRCRVQVYNTGNPIPEEDLSHLWEKFYKVDKAHSRQYGGTGVGLSIVRAVIEAHDGICGVENKAEGVEFWFEIQSADN